MRTARRYRDLGWNVIPILPRSKRPPKRFPLKRYFRERATDRDVSNWFSGESNMAVCLGDVSDGLCVRDFDVEASYTHWAARHPRLADRLPTVRTARGHHVYFTADVHDVRDLSATGSDSLMLEDGELKAGGYVLLPHSVHPSGTRYEWEIEPDDAPFVGDISGAGFVPNSSRKNLHQSPRVTQEIISCVTGQGLTVEQAVEWSQPTGAGERHRRIFDLCRMLKSTPLADAEESALRPVFERWFRLAKPRIRTKSFQTSWIEFLSGWQRVKRAHGATISSIAAATTGTGIEQLESICQQLQAVAGESAFFLDCRTAGRLVGVDHMTAWRWLKRLRETGKLELVKCGSRVTHRASEYLWIGN